MHASPAMHVLFPEAIPAPRRVAEKPLRDELLSMDQLDERARALAARFTAARDRAVDMVKEIAGVQRVEDLTSTR